MVNRSPGLIGLVLLVLVFGACSDLTSPVRPSPGTPPAFPGPADARLLTFTEEGTGFSTTDLHDAEDEVLQINTYKQLIWVADGTMLPGYTVTSHSDGGVTVYWIDGNICPQGCAFEVRFGAKDGQRRAYLTVDYGHENPGTVVDVEIVDGQLAVTPTSIYTPGSPTLSGVVYEETPGGRVPVEGASILLGISTGWRYATADASGSYEIRGLFDGNKTVHVTKEGFAETQSVASIKGDTRLDVLVVRR